MPASPARRARAACLLLLAAAACRVEARNADGQPPEAVSLLGTKLYARTDSGVVARADSALGGAARDVQRLIDAAAAYAGAWRFTEAIELYTQAMEIDSSDARLYRHRGHRYISVRRFDDAIADLERAVRLDSTSFDIAYHLGLAHYLAGHWSRAAEVYHACLAQAVGAKATGVAGAPAGREAGRSMAVAPAGEAAGSADSAGSAVPTATPRTAGAPRTCAGIAIDDDARVAMSDWYYRTLRRAGRDDEAAALLASIDEGMRVSSNLSYHNALLFYKAQRSDSALLAFAESDSVRFSTAGYALAHWRLLEGDTAGALPLLERIARAPHWPGFGVIAAEVELARLRRH